MLYLELIMTVGLYYAGYLAYSAGDTAATAVYAVGSAVAAFLFLRNIWYGQYVNMTLKKIDRLSGKAFEQYLMVQFKRMGYRVRMTDESHDYGADLILNRKKECIVVQAKRYERNIGISAIQEVVGSIAYYEADRAMVVTNRYFTKSARNLAEQNGVELWDREEIRRRFRIK